MSFKVFKSGGVSTGTAQGYQLLEAEVRKEIFSGHKVVLVVSAPDQNRTPKDEFRVTPLLRRKARGEDTLERVMQIYEDIAQPLGFQLDRTLFGSIARAQREDDIVSLGEHVQAWQVNRFLSMRGLNSRWIDARDAIETNSSFGNGKVLKVNKNLFLESDDVYVIGGFYGADSGGSTVILPKGGSDLTADVIAASLKAEEYVNLKDVPGIYAANPLFVQDPCLIEYLTYRELRELSYAGNAVLQEEAMTWCRREGVPIVVRSLVYPNSSGTRIVQQREVTQRPLVGVAAKDGFVIYIIERKENDPAFFQDLLDTFSRRGISIDMIGTENGVVSLAIENEELEKDIQVEGELGARYNIRSRMENQALVSLVGEGIAGPLTLRDRVFEVLDRDVNANYGPILGGREPGTTIYYIERFGMNSEYGIAQQIVGCFQEAQAPISGVSTTIDSMSIGTHTHSTKEEIRRMCDLITERINPDVLSVRRNGLHRGGVQKAPSNVTVAVSRDKMEAAVRKLYAEFF